MAAGCTAQSRRAGGYFILGRAVGIMIIGLLFIAIGAVIQGYTIIFIALFSILSVVVGVVMMYEAVSGRRLGILERISLPMKRRTPAGQQFSANEAGSGNVPEGVTENAGRCHTFGDGCRRNRSNECPDRANDPGGRNARIGFFLLGVMRGATPCLKLMVLVPLLLASGVFLSLLMLVMFSLSSSIFPILGFAGIGLLEGAEKYSRHIKASGGLLICLLGIIMPYIHFTKVAAGV